jgi:hypothetical protein
MTVTDALGASPRRRNYLCKDEISKKKEEKEEPIFTRSDVPTKGLFQTKNLNMIESEIYVSKCCLCQSRLVSSYRHHSVRRYDAIKKG